MDVVSRNDTGDRSICGCFKSVPHWSLDCMCMTYNFSSETINPWFLQNKLEFNNDLVMCSFVGRGSSLLILDRRSTKYETMIQFDGI